MESYNGKKLSEFSLDQLRAILAHFKTIEDERAEARQHEKFNVDKIVGNKKIPKMNFPEPNPNYLKLKEAIELEIKERNKNA